MKNILVSIDFSSCARMVALCTAELAQAAGARLILFHVYQAEAAETEGETDTTSERFVQAQLDKLARQLHSKTGVSITRLMKPATVANEAMEIAKLVKADIAVVCDHSLQSKDILIYNYHNLPVITAATAFTLDSDNFKQHLSAQLNSLGCSPAPLLEAI
ncbi:hypothetical protein ABID22_002845 [Pontibacter aydingkolensis]|uniref:Universal stress protein n=1 Tax=Pontibacter aydingkolensis TaxID=1911536 RepID=A0ABS7CY31_9BACT|nr:universal stress protein [Pontibacter aydingkolensis]MBW7468432.1 universal stress protein [Pontibacter aydingkolensis]